jgi:hypothetical protein
MKIAQINHYRCGESDAQSYVWVPDDMAADQLQVWVDKAQKEYDIAVQALEKLHHPLPPPGYAPDYSKYPDKTVAEIEKAHAVRVSEWAIQGNIKKTAQRNFGQILKGITDGKILTFYEVAFSISADVDWGHRHGKQVDYGETDIKDFYPNFDTYPGEEDGS